MFTFAQTLPLLLSRLSVARLLIVIYPRSVFPVVWNIKSRDVLKVTAIYTAPVREDKTAAERIREAGVETSVTGHSLSPIVGVNNQTSVWISDQCLPKVAAEASWKHHYHYQRDVLCVSESLSVCMSVCLSVCLSVRLSVSLFVRPSACLSVCLSESHRHTYIHTHTHTHTHSLSLSLSLSLSIFLFD